MEKVDEMFEIFHSKPPRNISLHKIGTGCSSAPCRFFDKLKLSPIILRVNVRKPVTLTIFQQIDILLNSCSSFLYIMWRLITESPPFPPEDTVRP